MNKELQNPAYHISGRALDEHFKQIDSVFRSGNKSYARWMLSATPYACASCHTQLPNAPAPLWEIDGPQIDGGPKENADFLFATRNYKGAESLYTSLIRSFPGKLLPGQAFGTSELESSLRRKLTIFVRVRQDFKAAVESFETDLKNPNLPQSAKTVVEQWLVQLKKLAKSGASSESPSSTSVLKRAEAVLDNLPRGFVAPTSPKLVDILDVAGKLYRALQANPADSTTPSLLYCLGVADLTQNNEFFFSLGTTYLKECIRGYPKSPVAKRCFGEYEMEIKNLYTGTRGTDIPSEVQEEVVEFRNLVGIDI